MFASVPLIVRPPAWDRPVTDHPESDPLQGLKHEPPNSPPPPSIRKGADVLRNYVQRLVANFYC